MQRALGRVRAGSKTFALFAAPEAPETVERPLPPALDTGRLPGWAEPTEYALDLTVDPRQPSFLGRVRIQTQLSQKTDYVVLHADGPKVLTAAARSLQSVVWARARQRPDAGSAGEELVLQFEEAIGPGSVELDLEFEALFADGLRGLYRVQSGEYSYAFSQMEPSDARRAFPCFDEPGFKTPFSLTLSVPTGYLAAANAPAQGETVDLPSGLSATKFQATPPLPTYLVALAVGPLQVTKGPAAKLPLRVLSLPGKGKLAGMALETASAQLGLLEAYFGEPYPYAKLDLVAVPEMSAGAMENPGLVTFREDLLLQDPKHAGAEAKRGLALIMAHELANQWFGNSVTSEWWDDLWLNEGLATWMGAKIADRQRPTLGIAAERAGARSKAMQLDQLASARSVRQPVRTPAQALASFNTITYVKGSSVIGMVEAWLGEAVTRRAMQSYARSHRHANASASDLMRALESASGKPVAGVVSSFVDQSGVPLLEMKLACSGKQVSLEVRQQELAPLGRSGAKAKLWQVPVCIRAQIGTKPQRVCVLHSGKTTRHQLALPGCPRLWSPNDAESGYYVSKLEPAVQASLARNAQKFLSPRERAGLLAGSFALVQSGQLELIEHVKLLAKFSVERERGVWLEILRQLHVLDYWVPAAGRTAFAKFVRTLLSPTARALGITSKPEDAEGKRLLRSELWAVLADLGQDGQARDRLSKLAKRWLATSEPSYPDMARVALVSHSRRAGQAHRTALMQRLARARLPEERMVALSGLAGFEDLTQLKAVLEATLSDAFRVQDLASIYVPPLGRAATGAVVAKWLRDNFERVDKRLPRFAMRRIVTSLGAACDPGLAQAFADTIAQKAAEPRAFQMQLSRSVEQAKLCAAAREAHGAAFGKLSWR